MTDRWTDRQTDGQTDGQTFAIVESLSRLKRTKAVVALRIMKKLGGG